jgi:hypothetical protein
MPKLWNTELAHAKIMNQQSLDIVSVFAAWVDEKRGSSALAIGQLQPMPHRPTIDPILFCPNTCR